MASRRLWTTVYSLTRRKHRHRCRACWRPVTSGESVVMLKLRNGRRSWVLHVACADVPHACGTWMDAFEEWAAPPARIIRSGQGPA